MKLGYTRKIYQARMLSFIPKTQMKQHWQKYVLSAYFSKARESSSVPVDYTEIRHVKKPNGAKPGFVIYFEQKRSMVTPDESIVMQLKK